MCPSEDLPADESTRRPASKPETPPSAIVQEVRELLLAPQDADEAKRLARLHERVAVSLDVFLEVLADPSLRAASSAGGGWGPVRAAVVLAKSAPLRAARAMLDSLATTERATPLYEALFFLLQGMARERVEPIMERLPTASGEYRKDLLMLLAQGQVHQRHVFDVLLQLLEQDPAQGAQRLGEYGDPVALPYLHATFDRYQLGPADDLPEEDSTVFELHEAIDLLGGTLTPEQQRKYERAVWSRRIQVDRIDPPRQRRSRPEASCLCGSGRSYRDCCLQ